MIATAVEAMTAIDCGGLQNDQIVQRLAAIESVIRTYCNNNFQNRNVRFAAAASGRVLFGTHDLLTVGDTVQISESKINNGLYTVTAIDDSSITVDHNLRTDDHNLVTLIMYPEDVKQCALDLFSWWNTMGNKVGVKSETISRHSVTYEDSQTLFMGYPMGILKGLSLYCKVRC